MISQNTFAGFKGDFRDIIFVYRIICNDKYCEKWRDVQFDPNPNSKKTGSGRVFEFAIYFWLDMDFITVINEHFMV